jgi:hypothetical protein
MAGVNVGVIGSTPSESPSAELVGVDSLGAVVVGTSLVVLSVGVLEGSTEEATVDDGRSDSILDDDTSDGEGVAEGRRDVLSWAVGVGDSSDGLSSCLRTAAACGAPATDCRHKTSARQRRR